MLMTRDQIVVNVFAENLFVKRIFVHAYYTVHHF